MSKKHTLLIIDDEKHTREGLRTAFEESFEVYVAADGAGALAVMDADPVDIVITDLRLGAEDGMDLVGKILKRSHPPICMIMTAYGSVDTAVEAMKRGAYDFVTKPINIDRLEILIRRALREKAMQQENRQLRQEVERKTSLEGMIGRSPAMIEVFDTIRQVASSRATVLIQGESGTGKEVAACAIHHLSPRASRKMISVHCMALSAQLLESELFGHEKGAFTGATERRIGRFEQAQGSTLFLDEIGEIDPAVQIKILRVLGERTFERVGGNQTLQADVRLVTATNRDLAHLVTEGKFREDLFFRLNVVQLTLPPLRKRKEDIPLLVQNFLKTAARENDKPFRELTPEALRCLVQYEWPGNVRELRTAVEHGVVMCSSAKIDVRDLPNSVRNLGPPLQLKRVENREVFNRETLSKNLEKPPKDEEIEAIPAADLFEVEEPRCSEWKESQKDPNLPSQFRLRHVQQSLILQVLEECRGNRTEAAKRLGVSRRTLHRRLKAWSEEEEGKEGGGE